MLQKLVPTMILNANILHLVHPLSLQVVCVQHYSTVQELFYFKHLDTPRLVLPHIQTVNVCFWGYSIIDVWVFLFNSVRMIAISHPPLLTAVLVQLWRVNNTRENRSKLSALVISQIGPLYLLAMIWMTIWCSAKTAEASLVQGRPWQLCPDSMKLHLVWIGCGSDWLSYTPSYLKSHTAWLSEYCTAEKLWHRIDSSCGRHPGSPPYFIYH